MYNLLVSADEDDWTGGPVDLERSRCVAEYTDPEIAARFGELKPDQVRELCALPCVFAYEKPCAKDPRFGVLRTVRRLASGHVRIEYSILPCEPFVTAGDLESLGRELDITRFELNRTHWAVKDVDLALELGRRGVALPGWASGRRQDVDIERHRFRVALSFPGEQRAYVEKVAGELDHLLGPDACFYDRFYEGQLARPNLDGLLERIYGERSDLVVVFVSAEYDGKLWPDVEWRKIRERGATGDDREIMYVRLGEGEVTGMTRLDGYVDGRVRGPEEVARMIADRVRLGESAAPRGPENGLGVEGTAVGQPSVRLHLVDRDTGEGLGQNVVVEDSTWFDVPSPEKIPDYRPGTPVGSGMVRVIQHEPFANSSYYRDLAEYLQTDGCFRATLELENTSGSVIHDARLAIELSDPDRVYELLGSTDRPSWPERSTTAILSRVAQVVGQGDVYVRREGDSWKVDCHFGKLQPRTRVRLEEDLLIGCRSAQDVEIRGRVYGDNVVKPIVVVFSVSFASGSRRLSVQEIKEIAKSLQARD